MDVGWSDLEIRYSTYGFGSLRYVHVSSKANTCLESFSWNTYAHLERLETVKLDENAYIMWYYSLVVATLARVESATHVFCVCRVWKDT